ncbi:MAG: tRNA lysidine(34) synthetase TilS [Candidatus Omnitrophota bacterium]
MFLEKIRRTVKKFNLLGKGDKVVIALSGGPDSTALLLVLNALKKEYNLKLHIAHLDHMFRGEKEAKVDYDFVLNLANRLKLPFNLGKANVPKYAKDTRLSLEEAARQMRYEFLLNVAKDAGANKVALGHTVDDQVETVLMRLIRGAGLGGLRGIPATRKLNGKFIVRPLIEVWRKDVEAYLRSLKIKPRQDVTNLMPKFLRNRIRHELIPYLEKFNPNIKKALARNAQNISYDYEVLAGLVDEAFKGCAKVRADSVEIKLRYFKTVPIGLRRQILRKAIEVLKGNLRRIDYSHIEDIESLIESKRGSLDLPDKIRAAKKKDSLVFYRLRDLKILRSKIYRELTVPGKTFIPELNLIFDAKFVRGKANFKKSKRSEYLDYDKVKLPLYVRTWAKGDRFKPLGMAAKKKLQDFFVDEKVPRNLRGSIPLLICGKKIIWVCGLRLSDDVKIIKGTKHILKLSIGDVPFGDTLS